MEATKTYEQKIIPESVIIGSVIAITINPKTKSAVVEIEEENGNIRTFTSSLKDEWEGVSTANKNVIRSFLKKLVSVCMETSESNITGNAL